MAISFSRLIEQVGRDAAQIEPLATGKNRRQHLLRFGGGKKELHVRRRFLQRFQQRIERFLGQHVDFVDDVDLEPAMGRGVAAGFPQFADLVDAAIAGAVDLQHVQGDAVGDLAAVVAPLLLVLSSHGVVVGCLAVRQFSALAKMRAVEVLPMPRGPTNR